jgi:hypothetical protein
VNNHDDGHDQGQNVHEVVGGLEDERVGDLNCPRVAVCLYACTAIDLLLAHQSAQRYRGLCTYRREVAEAHVCVLLCLRMVVCVCVARGLPSESARRRNKERRRGCR